jgi:hypothetical protein
VEMKAEEYSMLALVEKTREVIRKESLTLELFEILDARMNWLIRFCLQHGISLPTEQLATEEARIKHLMGEIAGVPSSDGNYHRDDSDEDLPEPKEKRYKYERIEVCERIVSSSYSTRREAG